MTESGCCNSTIYNVSESGCCGSGTSLEIVKNNTQCTFCDVSGVGFNFDPTNYYCCPDSGIYPNKTCKINPDNGDLYCDSNIDVEDCGETKYCPDQCRDDPDNTCVEATVPGPNGCV